MPNDKGFVGNLNELVQQYFQEPNALAYNSTDFPNVNDKYSYIYNNLIRTKGPDMIKMANLQNYLAEWDRTYSFGSWIRSSAIAQARPLDPPTFANGSDPNNGQIRKADISTTYHPFRVRLEFFVTNFANQLKDSMTVPEEISVFLSGVLQSLSDGANDTLYRLYKEVIHKYWTELTTAQQTAMSATLPPITDETSAIAAINLMRDYVTDFMFGADSYNSQSFKHTVSPDRQRLYIQGKGVANKMVDFLKLGHWMGDVNYADIAGSISGYLGIPVKLLDDFGGMQPLDADSNPLFPIYDTEGAVTGTFAATDGGTTPVDVASWAYPADYTVKALLTEDDFGNVFPINDSIQTQNFLRGGGYTNTSRYIERMLVAKPQSNTVFFV